MCRLQDLLEPIPHIGRADALVIDLAMMITALFAREDLHRFLFRSNRVKVFSRLAQGNLLIAFAMRHQEGASDFLHNAVELEWRETVNHVVL